MKTNEDKVIQAAKEWVDHPSDSRGQALVEAVRALEANTCSATGIGGDPAWPHSYKCNMTKHEGKRHMDPYLGSWDAR